jgi:hypothetical protein
LLPDRTRTELAGRDEPSRRAGLLMNSTFLGLSPDASEERFDIVREGMVRY